MRAIRTSFAITLALSVFAVSAPVEADKRPTKRGMMRPPMRQPLVSVAVVGPRGMDLPRAMHRGRTFVAGEQGQRYAIELTNNTRRRVEVVVSVDGRDVVSGKRADFRRQRGYVLGPLQTIEIEGFRQSLQRVATFRFSDIEHSYAARRGSKRNVGVIGVAVFKERARRMMKNKKRHRAPRAGADATTRDRRPEKLGTEYGESRMSAVQRVSFDRADPRRPDLRTAIFYDSMNALVARGVPIGRPVAVEPDAFAAPPGPMTR